MIGSDEQRPSLFGEAASGVCGERILRGKFGSLLATSLKVEHKANIGVDSLMDLSSLPSAGERLSAARSLRWLTCWLIVVPPAGCTKHKTRTGPPL